MRTKSEVRKWALKQGLLGRIILNHKRYGASKKLAYGEGFISSTFEWAKTPEKTEFWARMNSMYLLWYNYE